MKKLFILMGIAIPSYAMANGTTVIYTPNNIPYEAAYGATQALVNTITPNATTPYARPGYGGPAGSLAQGVMGQYDQQNNPPMPQNEKPKSPPKTKLSKPSIVLPPVPSQSANLSAGQTVSGRGEAVAGNMFVLKGNTIVLSGVPAVSKNHLCAGSNGLSYHCGYNATRSLQNILENGPVSCRVTSGGNPAMAECSILGQSVNKAMADRIR